MRCIIKMKTIKLLSALFTVVFLVCAFAFGASADVELNYGRMKLSEMERGEDYVGAYDAIYEGIASRAQTINLAEYALSYDELSMIYDLYIDDSGEHYHIGNKVDVSGGNVITNISPSYLSGTEKSKYDAAVAEFVALTSSATSEYEKALILHDALVKSITYDVTAANAHNSYGALVDGRAVCEGYAESYQVLLEEVGIMSYVVRGIGKTSVGQERHAWNLVRLDGKYYYSDLTWDDPTIGGVDESHKPVSYAYFNMPDKYFINHFPDNEYDLLPKCNDVDKMYHDLVIIDEYTVEGVASAFRNVNGHATARIFCLGDSVELYTLIAQNFQGICDELETYGEIKYTPFFPEIYIEILNPMTDHVYDNACDEACNVCGHKRVIFHRFGLVWCASGGKHWHECTVCGMHADDSPHIDDGGICTACGEPVIISAGNLDGDDEVSANDAIYLLYSVFFGEGGYPLNQSCDFDGNNAVDANDAIYLLYHVFFGEDGYPLN